MSPDILKGAKMPYTSMNGNTVNALFRIGDQLTARFPLQPGEFAATLRWLEAEAEAGEELFGLDRLVNDHAE